MVSVARFDSVWLFACTQYDFQLEVFHQIHCSKSKIKICFRSKKKTKIFLCSIQVTKYVETVRQIDASRAQHAMCIQSIHYTVCLMLMFSWVDIGEKWDFCLECQKKPKLRFSDLSPWFTIFGKTKHLSSTRRIAKWFQFSKKFKKKRKLLFWPLWTLKKEKIWNSCQSSSFLYKICKFLFIWINQVVQSNGIFIFNCTIIKSAIRIVLHKCKIHAIFWLIYFSNRFTVCNPKAR